MIDETNTEGQDQSQDQDQDQGQDQGQDPELPNPSFQLIRDAAILQLKLVADGARDAVLIPISIIATLVGLARGGDEPDREFRRVIKMGRRSERWINLFGHQRPLGKSHPAGSLDTLLDRVEEVVIDQYKRAQTEAEAREAISRALQPDPDDSADSEKRQ
jgi:hypothetical protein